MYTVYCTDTFDNDRWQEQFATEEEALFYADRTAGVMVVCYVDDPQGRKVYRAGQF